MAVQLILLDNVENLGKIGQVVNVSAGYARNYLVPRGLAAKAAPGALRQLEARKAQLEVKYAEELAAAQTLAGSLNGTSVTIPVQADEDGKLFGSVNAQQIVDSLAEMQFTIDRKQIVLADAIRHVDAYDIEVALHPEVSATIKVWVVKA